MKFIILFFIGYILSVSLYGGDTVLKNVSAKKQRFYNLIVPVVHKVHTDLMSKYKTVLQDMKDSKNRKNIQDIKKLYRVVTDKELLLALKPHPESIAIAQAAIESGWATSRFFIQANNIFGVWSTNKFQPRIAATQKRGGVKTIWLRKFNSLEESVRDYYKMIATVKAYKEFRILRYESKDVMKMVEKLDKYSELDKKYTIELASIIKYNNLTKYDN